MLFKGITSWALPTKDEKWTLHKLMPKNSIVQARRKQNCIGPAYPYLPHPSAYVSMHAEARGMLTHEFDKSFRHTRGTT